MRLQGRRIPRLFRARLITLFSMSLTIYSIRHKVMPALLILCAALMPATRAYAATVGEPVFESPEYGSHQLPPAPTIHGFTDAGSRIEVHIDGQVAGTAAVTEASSDRVPFSFMPLEPLSPGYHSLEAFASDTASQKDGRQSLWWFFQVADPLPAPIIRAATEYQDGILMVSGVVKSGHKVRIMVDGIERMSSKLWIHASGASGFTVAIPSLAHGVHTIIAYAVREDGEISAASDPVSITMTGIAAAPRVSVPRAPKPEAPKKETMIRIEPVLPVSETVPPLPEPTAEEPEELWNENGNAGLVTIVPPVVISATSVSVEELALQASATADASRTSLPLFIVLVMVLIIMLVWYMTSRREEAQFREPVHNPFIAPSSPSPLPQKTFPPFQESPPRISSLTEEAPLPPPPPSSNSSLPFDYM